MGTILSNPDIPERTLLAMWHQIFVRGFRACPTLGFFSSGVSVLNALLLYANGFCADASWAPSTEVYIVLLSGLFMFGMVPYTLTWVVPLEEMLLKRERDIVVSEEGPSKSDGNNPQRALVDTTAMLHRWVALNYYRMVIPFVGVIIGLTLV